MTTAAAAPASRLGILPIRTVQLIAEVVARKEAHTPDDVDDLVQVAMLAYHKAVVRCTRQHLSIEKPQAFARMTCQRAMRGYYWQQREWQGRGEPNKAVSIEQVELLSSATPGDQLERVELSDYFTALERACGRAARIMVENLVLPHGECCARLLQEVRAKQGVQADLRRRRCVDRRHQPRGVKKQIRITPRMIRDALGMSPSEWSRTMTRVRVFTRAYLAL